MRWGLRLLGGVIGLGVLVFVSLPFLPAQSIADMAAREISASTGRMVTIGGKISAVIYPTLGVKTGELTLQNAPWGDAKNMITAKGLVIGIEFWPLLSGKVKISKFILDTPDIRLERAKDGQANWTLGTASSGGAGSTNSTHMSTGGLSLALAKISSGKLSFVDHRAQTSVVFKDANLRLSLPDFKGRTFLKGNFSFEGNRTTISGGIDETALFVSGGISDFDLAAKSPLGLLSLTGRAGISPSMAELDFDVKVLNLPALLKLAGQEADLVKGYGDRAALKGHLTIPDDGTAYIRGMTASVGANEFKGEMDVALGGGRPKILARLSAGALDISPVLGTSPTDESHTKNRVAQPGWSLDRLSVDPLALIDADVVLSAESIDLGLLKLDTTKLRARLDSARLVLSLKDVRAYGGSIGGDLIVNGRSGLSIRGDLSAGHIDMKRLLVDLAGYDRLSTHADFNLKFLGKGDSVNALMNSLSGSGRFIAASGDLAGLDLAGMLRNMDASYMGEGSKTIFSAITGGFTIAGGILSNDDLSFRSSLLTARGDGQVDIGKQQVTYRLTPVSLSDVNPLGKNSLNVPLLITGPWSGLHYKVDLKGVFDNRLKTERKKAEKRLQKNADIAGKKAKKKLRKELDKAIKNGVGKLLRNRLKQ